MNHLTLPSRHITATINYSFFVITQSFMENPAFTPDQNESEFIVDNEETDELRELAGVKLYF